MCPPPSRCHQLRPGKPSLAVASCRQLGPVSDVAVATGDKNRDKNIPLEKAEEEEEEEEGGKGPTEASKQTQGDSRHPPGWGIWAVTPPLPCRAIKVEVYDWDRDGR